MIYIDREIVKGVLPVIVLSVLRQNPMHGYALLSRLREDYGAVLRLGAGTLYPLLKRLERRGWLQSRMDGGDSGRPRRVYRVTPEGMRTFKEQRRQMRVLSAVLRHALGKKQMRRPLAALG